MITSVLLLQAETPQLGGWHALSLAVDEEEGEGEGEEEERDGGKKEKSHNLHITLGAASYLWRSVIIDRVALA